MDVAFVLAALLFWVVMMGLIAGLDRLGKPAGDTRPLK
jgi:hypothetical protein